MFSLFQWPASDISKEDTKNISGMCIRKSSACSLSAQRKAEGRIISEPLSGHIYTGEKAWQEAPL